MFFLGYFKKRKQREFEAMQKELDLVVAALIPYPKGFALLVSLRFAAFVGTGQTSEM